MTVTLSSSDEGEATVPTEITIPINVASMTFPIDAVDDAIVDGTQVVTIAASAADYVDGSGDLDVTDDGEFTLTVTIDPTSVSEAAGAAAATGTVTRNNDDLGSTLTVTLSSSDPSEATVAASVTIPADAASATFSIDAVNDTVADGTQIVTISAEATDYVDGSVTLHVTDDEGSEQPHGTGVIDLSINDAHPKNNRPRTTESTPVIDP